MQHHSCMWFIWELLLCKPPRVSMAKTAGAYAGPTYELRVERLYEQQVLLYRMCCLCNTGCVVLFLHSRACGTGMPHTFTECLLIIAYHNRPSHLSAVVISCPLQF
jgi:hypothetical protein